jgi:hypothetical protein
VGSVNERDFKSLIYYYYCILVVGGESEVNLTPLSSNQRVRTGHVTGSSIFGFRCVLRERVFNLLPYSLWVSSQLLGVTASEAVSPPNRPDVSQSVHPAVLGRLYIL